MHNMCYERPRDGSKQSSLCPTICILVAFCMQAVDAERLIDWLQHVEWHATHFILPYHTDDKLAKAQMSVLSALKLLPTAQRNVRIELQKWSFTSKSMAFLSALSHWGGKLDMDTCLWFLKRSKCTQAAKQIPASYSAWRVSKKVSRAYIGAMCEGIEQGRSGGGLAPLGLSWRKGEVGRKVGESVVFEYW